MMRRFSSGICPILILILFAGCHPGTDQETSPPFRLLTAAQTGLHFENNLVPSTDLNIFDYMYFYNGGGVAVADFNNDGLLDIYFAGNQRSNALYLNLGNLTFKDVTSIAGVSGEGGWSTGVTVTDINHDGWLDIYVSQVGDFRKLHGHNRLYRWKEITGDGIPVYEEVSAEYGLDLIGFGTQACFFDYDLDGDLDLFQLNHSVHHNGTFGQRKEFEHAFHQTAGDRLFRNDDGKFRDVTVASGIHSSAVGYGLGVAFSDINLDGWPDIYVANDFHENDYLYINQKDGTFKESLNEMIRHTSRFSMGVDIADINNDGHGEIFTLDMHPDDPLILKSSLGDDDYGIFQFKLSYGYNHQYARNTLQLNNQNNTFSEIGIYANIYASDWSWSCLFLDFDHDGYKDVFITNGIPRRMNDIDYVNFTSENEFHWKIQMNELEETDLNVEATLPEIKLINRFYRNNGDLTFHNISTNISNTLPSFSNGAAYGDFDNDGDLDIVVNNIRDAVFLYENLLHPTPGADQHYISLHLTGPSGNPLAIGAKVIAYKGEDVLTAEQYPVRGYLSFVSPVLHLGLGAVEALDSILLIWPDHTIQPIPKDSIDKTLRIRHMPGMAKYRFRPTGPEPLSYRDVTQEAGIRYVHQENEFVEFNREQLIPHMTSTEGPALAVGDVNHDGLDDFFVGSSKRKKSALYLQTPEGKFMDTTPHSILQDSLFEDVDAAFADIDGDGDLDLVVASGGNEYSGTSLPLTQRIYLNDGNGQFISDTTALPKLYMTAGCVALHDINQDGFVDIFFGGRAVPWNYGQVPASYLLLNDGHGKFSDVTSKYARELSWAGMVKDAYWEDMDNNGLKDLVLAVEWGPLQIYYQNNDHTFRRHEMPGSSGFWNCVLPYDFDQDGDMDFIAGNLGQNSKLKASLEKPVQLYVNDFDGNGQIEQLMTYYIGAQEIIFPTYREVMRQLPSLKKDFLMAKDFARAGPDQLVGKDMIRNATKLSVTRFESSYYENVDNKGHFIPHALPPAFQFSPLRATSIIDFNHDAYMDLLLAGNYYENNIELGRYDADYGSLWINSSSGLLYGARKNLSLEGQVRRIEAIQVRDRLCYLIAINDGPLRLITFHP